MLRLDQCSDDLHLLHRTTFHKFVSEQFSHNLLCSAEEEKKNCWENVDNVSSEKKVKYSAKKRKKKVMVTAFKFKVKKVKVEMK